MIFKLLIVIMSLLIFDSDSYHVPKDGLPSPWALYRYNVIKALGPKRDVTPINDTGAQCQDSPLECNDQEVDHEATTIISGSGKMKKLNMVDSMDIWRILAEQSKVVILMSDTPNAPRNE